MLIAIMREKNIVHNDIKSENLLIDSNGDLHLIDFGLAKIKRTSFENETMGYCGTLRYMPPEFKKESSKQYISYSRDVFSAAAVWHELLCER